MITMRKGIRIKISTVKIRQFILQFSTTYFGLKGHRPVEHDTERMSVHSVCGIEISKAHNLCPYVGVPNRITLESRVLT
jgi:hypothetical protein